MRLQIAIAAGIATTVLLAYLGLVIFLLAAFGIPLGATPEPLRPVHHTVLLVMICLAALVGGRTAGRLADSQRRVAVTIMSVILVVGALWGFSGANEWPSWWGEAVAVAVVAGACGGVSSGIRRSSLTR